MDETFLNESNAASGNTIWGANSNLGGYIGAVFAEAMGGPDMPGYNGDDMAFTIAASGEHDTLDLSPLTSDATIDMRPETFSDFSGVTGNMGIARGTIIEDLLTGSGDDTVQGNYAGNAITTGSGADSVDGGSGFDSIIGGDDNHTLRAWDEGDRIGGGGGEDEILGGAGNDTVYGGIYMGETTIYGNGGDDEIYGSIDNDTIWGDAGDDNIGGNLGNDTIYGGTGDDTVRGYDGADTFVFEDRHEQMLVEDFDFSENDMLELDADLWGGGVLTGSQVISTYGNVIGGDLVLDFGGGDIVTLQGITNTTQMANYIDLV